MRVGGREGGNEGVRGGLIMLHHLDDVEKEHI